MTGRGGREFYPVVHFRSVVGIERILQSRIWDTDAIRTKATAEFTLVYVRNDIAMRDHDSLEVKCEYL